MPLFPLNNKYHPSPEHLIIPGIEDRFAELGIRFDSVSPHGKKIMEDRQIVAEVDLWLENREVALLVEVKSKLDLDDIRDHAGRLEALRGWLDRRGDRRRLLGAVAAAVMSPGERKAAVKAGFYAIVQSGDTMKIDVPKGFVPREW